MRLLARDARSKGWSIRALAEECGKRQPTAFTKTLMAAKPRVATVEDVAGALGYSPIVARALLNRLTDRDISELQYEVFGQVSLMSASLFRNSAAASAQMQLRWPHFPREVRGAACAAFVLADRGLGDTPADPILGPRLGALERTLAPRWFSFHAFIADRTEILTRKREGVSYYSLLRWALGISVHDQVAISQIIAPYIGELPFDPRQDLMHAEARKSAQKEYRRFLRLAPKEQSV
jgi:hypothetical protein